MTDIAQAISLFGIRCLANWITILAMARINDKADELLTISLIRARMCEVLGKTQGLNTDTCFTLGLISTLDALLDMKFDDIKDRLPLANDIYPALLSQYLPPTSNETNQGHPLTELLQSIVSYERSNWDNPLLKRVQSGLLTETYFEAIAWASGVRRELLKPV